MTGSSVHTATRQGFGAYPAERLPLPARDAMTDTQSAAAEAIIAGGPASACSGSVMRYSCPGTVSRCAPPWGAGRVSRYSPAPTADMDSAGYQRIPAYTLV